MGGSAAKAQWEADKCSKLFGYGLKGKAGSKRPIPMASAKSLATRYYQLKCGHAPTGAYLKRFGHRKDDKCWWCGGTVAQMRSISSVTAAGGNTSSGSSGRRWGRKRAGRWAGVGRRRYLSCFPWRYVTIGRWASWRPLTLESCRLGEAGSASRSFLSFSFLVSFLFSFTMSLSARTEGSGWELRQLTGSPGGGGE